MSLKITPALAATYEFACHSSACRPPTSGGTGGSGGGKGVSGGKLGSLSDKQLAVAMNDNRPGHRIAVQAEMRRRNESSGGGKSGGFKSAAHAREEMNTLSRKKDRTPAEEARLKAAIKRSQSEGKTRPTEGD